MSDKTKHISAGLSCPRCLKHNHNRTMIRVIRESDGADLGLHCEQCNHGGAESTIKNELKKYRADVERRTKLYG